MDKIVGNKLIKADDVKKYIVSSAIKEIENFAFYGNYKMQELYLPDAVTSMGISSLEDCKNLIKIRISENMDIIPMAMCKGCVNLSEINIHRFLKCIGSFSFLGCEALKEVNIPKNVEKVGGFAFSDCTNVQKITIENEKADIEESAFYNCNGVRNITIGSKHFDIYPDERMNDLEIYKNKIFISTKDENDKDYIYTLSDDKKYFKKITKRQKLMMKIGISEVEYKAILADIKRACFDVRMPNFTSLLIRTTDSDKGELINEMLHEIRRENPDIDEKEMERRVFIGSKKDSNHKYVIDLDKELDSTDYKDILERCEEAKRTNDANELYENNKLIEASNYKSTAFEEARYKRALKRFKENEEKEFDAEDSYNPFKRFKASKYRNAKEKAYEELLNLEDTINEKARENAIKRENRPKQFEKTKKARVRASQMSKTLEEFKKDVIPFVDITKSNRKEYEDLDR